MDPYPKITEAESNSIDHATCPDCGKKELYTGPCGGMMVNIHCESCGSRFNIPQPNFPMPTHWSMKERIGPKSPKMPTATAMKEACLVHPISTSPFSEARSYHPTIPEFEPAKLPAPRSSPNRPWDIVMLNKKTNGKLQYSIGPCRRYGAWIAIGVYKVLTVFTVKLPKTQVTWEIVKQ